MAQQQVDAIRKQIVVRAPQRRAFEIFTGEMTRWWPKDHHIGSAPIQEIVIEPHEGGRWFTRHEDGSETSTGFVQAWEPYDRVVLTWNIDSDWKYRPDLITPVELRFIAEAPDRTRVELEHRDLERFGAGADHMREVFDGPEAWQATLEAYAAAVEES